MEKKDFPKRISLPYPSLIETNVLNFDELLAHRNELSNELELLDASISHWSIETICGENDLQDVELYDGSLGVSTDFVNKFEKPIGQLQWLDDLESKFQGSEEKPGNVSGKRWGSGSLIGDDIFITAGHCFDKSGGGWLRPSRRSKTIEPDEIATLMKVNFDFQVSKTTGQLKQGDSYPVIKLLEYREGSDLDYAIVKLGPGSSGELPGSRYGKLKLALDDLTEIGAMLCLIQHPSGKPKQIEAGPLLSNEAGTVKYDSLDTEGGSSGAPILGPTGEIIGVHTNGGCSRISGFNYGISVGIIRKVSRML